MESELSHQFKFINPRGKPYIKASLIRPIIYVYIFFCWINIKQSILYIYILKRPFFSYKYNKRMLCKKIKVLKLCILKIKLWQFLRQLYTTVIKTKN